MHDAAGRLLLVRRAHDPHRGRWSLPGGRVERGETAEQAVVREVREETGLEVEVGPIVGRVLIPGAEVSFDVVDFTCHLAGAAVAPVAGDDADDARFVDRRALLELPCTPRLVDVLGEWGSLPR